MSEKLMRISVALAVLALVFACAAGCLAYKAGDPEFRAFWVDSWGDGFLSQSQVNQLLGVAGDGRSKGDIRNANCNAVIVQVRRRADVCYPSAMSEPYFSGLSPSNFNALQAIINAAHDTTGGKQRIEVHCWLVTFATDGGTVWNAHNNPSVPDQYWATLDNNGAATSDCAFDPGHPKCEQYLTDVCMDMVNNFDIDGIHYDYIRFTASNQGYNPTSIARYNARYGTVNQPSPSDERFEQWRRDQVTALVRKVYAKIQSSKPWVLQSGALVTWNPSPGSSTRSAFQGTRPYYDVYSDWDSWMSEGIMDFAVPMTYYDDSLLPADYVRWMNFEKDRKFNRQMVVGPGIYKNTIDNAVGQIMATRGESPAGHSADGFCGYSYRVPCTDGSWSDFSQRLVSQATTTTAPVPVRPWKASPTKGHMSGTVTIAGSGASADGATVSVSGPQNRTQVCDGTGFYAFIDLTPGTYTVTASYPGYSNATATVNVAIGSVTGNMYVTGFVMGGSAAPVIGSVQTSGLLGTSVVINWSTDMPSDTRVNYGLTSSYGSQVIGASQVTSHSVTLTGLTPQTTYHYQCSSTNSYGTRTTSDLTFTTPSLPVISSVQASGLTGTSAVISWNTNVSADSAVNYGTSGSYGSVKTSSASVTGHVITLTGLAPSTTYHYQVQSTSSSGTGASGDYTFTTSAVAGEVIVDDLSPGASCTGTWTADSGGHDGYYAYVYNRRTSSTATFTWTPTLTKSGNYDVYCWYPSRSSATTNAKYTVYYLGGSTSKTFSQASNTGKWNLIASNLPFAAGTSGYVRMDNITSETNSTKYVAADAVRFVLVGGDSIVPTIPQNLTAVATSTTSVALNWSPATDDTGVVGYKVYRGGVLAGSSTTTSYNDTGLAANTRYSYAVSAYDAMANESAKSNTAARCTLSIPPTGSIVVCNKLTGSWSDSPDFAFANDGIGPGKVLGYRWVWDGAPTHAWTGAEPNWTLPAKTLTADSTTHPWYLHVTGFNYDGICNGTLDLGPYNYGITYDTIAAAMNNPDSSGVIVGPRKAITAVFGNCFYVEEADRARALRVDATTALGVGANVRFAGRLTGSAGERSLVDAAMLDSADGAAPPPVLTRVSMLGGVSPDPYTSGLAGTAGAYNVGLLVRVAGVVTSHGPGWFVVDDGSRATARVYSSASVADSAFAGVTGICTLEGSQRVIRTRTQNDVRIYAP
jgi:uncharacterized lipoprotein YddW (UPF0748 family)